MKFHFARNGTEPVDYWNGNPGEWLAYNINEHGVVLIRQKIEDAE